MGRPTLCGVGVRLASAFGLIAVLLMVVIGVGLSSVAAQRRAHDGGTRAADVQSDVSRLENAASALTASQSSYAFAAARAEVGATDDGVGHRKKFLLDVQAFEEVKMRFDAHESTGE